MRLLALILCFLAALSPARATESVVAGLSQNRVSITATFVGSEILIFGAVKRETKPPQAPLEVIVTVEGPSSPVTIRRKAKRFGIWINTDAIELARAPSFYAVATSATLTETVSLMDDLRHLISVERLMSPRTSAPEIDDPAAFTEALIRIREEAGLYRRMENAVNLQEDTLFDTRIALPANLTEGAYRTRIFLTRGGAVVADYATVIEVQKVGLERWIFNLAHERPLIYGLLSLVIAIAAGWGASAGFRMLMRT